MNKLKQIWYDLRQQPVISSVTIIGTALAIFLVMAVFMIQQIKVTPFAPESNRDRVLYGINIHSQSIGDGGQSESSSTEMAYDMSKKLYGDLEGIEKLSYTTFYPYSAELRVKNKTPFDADIRRTDEVFWQIFDHTFVEGKPYTQAEVDARKNVAVISESTAESLFGKGSAVGKEIYVNWTPYIISGVVKDHSKIATQAYAQIFIPFFNRYNFNEDGIHGSSSVVMLVEDGYSKDKVREQVKNRYSAINSELKDENTELVYHEAPYDQYTIANGLAGSNNTPDTSSSERMRLYLYIMLLLIPAINLSSMTHSRLHQRISEFGVRRAFGCTRMKIIADILAENFIITLIGGVIGLLLSVILMMTFSGLTGGSFLDMMGGDKGTATLPMLFQWSTFLYALLFCFVLNLISASVPAWIASRVNPAEAINEINR